MVIFSLLSVSLNSFLLYSYFPNLPFILWPLLSFQFLSFLFLPPFLSCSHLEHHTCFFLNLSLSFSLFRYLSISLSPYILLLSLFSLFPSSSSNNSFRSLSLSLSRFVHSSLCPPRSALLLANRHAPAIRIPVELGSALNVHSRRTRAGLHDSG